jgi:YesN/AraC family two-component response regulator
MMKHSKMDEAQRCMERAQYALQNFRKELSDVQMQADLKVNSDGLTKFFDIWCDNFLVDLMVQSRIKEAQENIRQAKRNVQETISRLERMR